MKHDGRRDVQRSPAREPREPHGICLVRSAGSRGQLRAERNGLGARYGSRRASSQCLLRTVVDTSQDLPRVDVVAFLYIHSGESARGGAGKARYGSLPRGERALRLHHNLHRTNGGDRSLDHDRLRNALLRGRGIGRFAAPGSDGQGGRPL